MDKAALGQKLRQARLDKGYTQQSLSEKADIGEVYLSEIERGLKMPSMNLFYQADYCSGYFSGLYSP